MLYASPSHESVLGFPVSQLEGRRLMEGFDPNYIEMQVQMFEEMIRNKQSIQTELKLQKSDGSWCFFDLSMTPVLDEDGNIEHVIGVGKNFY